MQTPAPASARPAALLTGLVAALALFAAPALALDSPAINAQSYEPSAAIEDGAITRSASRQSTGDWHALAALHYSNRSLVFVNHSGGVERVQTVLGDLWMLDLAASHGWHGWLFEAALPVAWLVRGGGPNIVQLDQPAAPVFGDMRLAARRHLWRMDHASVGTFDFAGLLGWAPPTATDGSWLGSGGTQIDLAALASWRHGPWRGHLEAGVRYRQRQALMAVVVDADTGGAATDEQGVELTQEVLSAASVMQIRFGAGRHLLDDRLRVRLEGQLRQPITSDVTPSQQLLELYADADWALGKGVWRLFGGVSSALTTGYGAARARVQLGVRFTPGLLPSDADGDGIDDRADSCPEVAEDADGFEDRDGCPDPDNDADGVVDAADRCPLIPEDIDGFEDDDGCPEYDNDHDGVADSADGCPMVAEDRDAFEDHDGCPDLDNDRDGIADVDDLCPDKAENRNQFEDHDGCPDIAPPPVVSRKGDRLFLTGRIRFDVGTASLASSGRKLLDSVANWLRANPKVIALEISAHTDNNGDAKALQALSLQRAEVARNYLARISPLALAHIKAIGLGSDRPLAPNDTAAGRTRNRRMELRILPQVPPTEPPPPQPKRKRRR
mgnify:CR=1 FL=1